MTRYLRPLVLGVVALGLMACSRMQPLIVVHQQVPANALAVQNEESLQPALIRALLRCRWTIEENQPNRLLARIDLRGRQSASITLDYVSGRYDIRYRDSSNLQYADGKIHKRYNSLVKKLDRAIQQEISFSQSLSNVLQRKSS